MCQAYREQYGFNAISAMPTNLYGPGDNFSLDNSHVVPALIRKIHEAKFSEKNSLVIWGSGEPRREFLYVDDLSDAGLFLLKNYNEEKTNNTTLIEKFENHRSLSIFLATAIFIYIAVVYTIRGFSLTLDIVSWTFLAFGLLLANSAMHYIKLVNLSLIHI